MEKEFGIIKGEWCDRDGCRGIIDEHEKDGGCSCHINPPCSYCTTDTALCPECGWEASDDLIEKVDPEVEKRNREYYEREMGKFEASRNLFYSKFAGKEPIGELEMRIKGHTHFSQKVIGVFPKGSETKESLLPKVKGTFGGRFTRFGEYNFEYIAYTD